MELSQQLKGFGHMQRTYHNNWIL